MVTYWRSESSNKGLVVLNKLILAIQNHFFEKFEKYFPKNPKQKVQKRKILNEKFDGFNLNIDLNISKKNKVITSLENTLKQLKRNEKSN